jgi:hypothetical protein
MHLDLIPFKSDWSDRNVLQVEILTCWTERGTCIWMVWLHELKKLSSPGMEAQPRDTWGESFQIFSPWLGSADKVVELEHALAAAKVVKKHACMIAGMKHQAVLAFPAARVHASIHTRVHASIHTCKHMCMHSFIPTCVNTWHVRHAHPLEFDAHNAHLRTHRRR